MENHDRPVRAGADVNHTIGIVAHTARTEQAMRLADQVEAAFVSVDDGTLGCENNHRKVWQWMADNATTQWSVVLEDDAKPVNDFRRQLDEALDNAPTPIVSLYLGRKRPPHVQDFIRQATIQADQQDACYVTATALFHAVGVAIRTDLVQPMLNATTSVAPPWDYTIGTWALAEHHTITYLWPSLLDHADQDTLIAHPDKLPRAKGRTAWRTGTRTNWTTTAVTL
jgi:GR25 family glycosyltransferase involved in LPS biosynthesis